MNFIKNRIKKKYKTDSVIIEKQDFQDTCDYAVRVRNFSYSYRNAGSAGDFAPTYRKVLNGINMDIKKNEKLTIIGPNGAGKSTLLLNIAGLMDESEGFKSDNCGNISIFGREISKRNLFEIREKIGFVFQNPDDQLFSTSVREDVSFGIINKLKRQNDSRAGDRAYIESVVRKCLDIVNLRDREDEIPHFLSFGEKKMCALATVLSYEPEIFILDEPSSNLDPKNRSDFIKLIKSLEKTVIVSTHDMDLAYEFSNRSIILYKGSIVYDGSTKEILQDRDFLQKIGLDMPLSIKNTAKF
ncbi:MAG TPA: cobalt ABC transporter ATP-binding protein [Actinobacteria bacterium]|nr:cobalt ABC transporter ATP-binding protein [Actinomycetota bacterium]